MDRIDELFTQAGGYIEIDKDGNRWTYSQECDPDTFAELIIRECIKLIEPNGEHRAESHHYLGGPEGVELLDNIVETIKKHFWSE